MHPWGGRFDDGEDDDGVTEGVLLRAISKRQ
jgi:hypothetical protein